MSYGAGYDFATNTLRPAPPIPGFLHALRAKVARRLRFQEEEVTHVLVTEPLALGGGEVPTGVVGAIDRAQPHQAL